MKRVLSLLALCFILFVSCATMQSISEKEVDRAPYYVNVKKNVSISADSVSFLPVILSQEKWFFNPSLEPLQTEVQKTLKAYVKKKFVNYDFKGQQRPKVSFGVDDFYDNDDEDNEVDPPLVFAISQPSKNWRETWDPPKAGYFLIVELNISAYKVRQKNWKGSKEVELGTDYKVSVPWLSSLDDPIPVVQLVGMIINQKGKILRTGAEGIYVKKTKSGLSLLGVTEAITEKDIEKIMTSYQRSDIEGKPLAYKVAVKNLLKQMLK